MKKLAVIVPCYNEELVIAESYRRTREALHKLPVLTEIIYINDGSRDRTRLMLDEIAASDPQVKVIHFSRNFGHQPAVTAGINNCDADLAVILDADMQDPPELIPSILELQEKGAGERGLLRPQVPRRGRAFQESDGEGFLPYAELHE